MRFFRIAAILLTVVFAIAFSRAQAQQSQPPDSQVQPQPPANPPQSAPPPSIIPPGIDSFRQVASSKTEFTLDHSMLVLASKFDPGDQDLQRVIAGISGVSVHNFRFPRPWMYDPAVLDSVRGEYGSGGWKQMVNNHDKSGQGTNSVWIRFDNNAISNVAMLFTRANQVDFVVVSGSISPMDLSHLGGHFGIPKIEGGVMVPKQQQ